MGCRRGGGGGSFKYHYTLKDMVLFPRLDRGPTNQIDGMPSIHYFSMHYGYECDRSLDLNRVTIANVSADQLPSLEEIATTISKSSLWNLSNSPQQLLPAQFLQWMQSSRKLYTVMEILHPFDGFFIDHSWTDVPQPFHTETPCYACFIIQGQASLVSIVHKLFKSMEFIRD